MASTEQITWPVAFDVLYLLSYEQTLEALRRFNLLQVYRFEVIYT